MGIEADIKTILEADSGVGGFETLLTGGIYTRTELKRVGLTKRNVPLAFDGPKLKPCALIRERTNTPDGKIMDEGEQTLSYVNTVIIILYDDGDSDRSTIESAEARLYVLLHAKKVTNFLTLFGGCLWTREEALDSAHMGRATYQVNGVR